MTSKPPAPPMPSSAPPPGPAAPAPRRRRAGFAAVAVALGVLAAVVLLEVGMRVLDVRPPRSRETRWLSQTPSGFVFRGKWGEGLIKRPSRFREEGVHMGEWVPGAVMKVRYGSNPRGYFDPDNSVTIRVNSLGLRGPEVSATKAPGSIRILGLGDSFTFGDGVREEDTFLRRLETSLNRGTSAAGKARYQVLNAGVQGYNTRDEVLYLERVWLDALDPDLVLIVFYLNDAYSDLAFLNMGEELGILLPQPAGLAQVSYLYDYLQHRRAARAVAERVEAYYQMSYFRAPAVALEGAPPGSRVDWRTSKAALARARELTAARGIKLIVAIFPQLHQLDGDYPFAAIHALVRDTCVGLGIPVVDLFPAFERLNAADLWVHPTDHHPNEVAHDRVATALIGPLTELLADVPVAATSQASRTE